MMRGDESYRGVAELHEVPRSVVQSIFGFRHVDFQRTRGARRNGILFNVMCKKGDIVPNNTHFDTTRPTANLWPLRRWIYHPGSEGAQPPAPFKGNMDVERLAEVIAREGRRKFRW